MENITIIWYTPASHQSDKGVLQQLRMHCWESFQVKTGVRQGCVMSSTLFIIAIDWVLRQTTADTPRGIRWGTFSTLEDLDFADDLALLSHTHQHIQEKNQQITNVFQPNRPTNQH